MKILLFGSNGQLGTDCSLILSPNHSLSAYNRAQADITNREQVDHLISKHQPEVIINCAAYTAVDRCETEIDLAWQVNAQGPENLARGARAINARLIHISTDYVFDGQKQIPHPYTEEDPVSPPGEYGKSKLAGEQAIQHHCPSHVILRTAWLYSLHGPNFLKTMLQLASQDKDREIKVVNDQYGSLTWSYSLAQQIEALLGTDLTGIFHATAEGHSTWYQAACAFLDRMDVPHNLVPCTTEEYPTPARRPANSILENKRLKEAGINLFRDWRDDLDLFVNRIQKKETGTII